MNKVAFWMVAALVTLCGIVWLVPKSYGAQQDPQLAEVERIWKKFHVSLILSEEGLTSVGYEIFFPGRDTVRGLIEWRKLSPFERLAFLKKEGASLPRGLWANQRNAELVRDIRMHSPGISDEGLNEIIGVLGIETVRACVTSQSMHPDLCIFFLGDIANRAEISAAKSQLGRYLWITSNERELDAIRRSSVRR